MTSRTPKFPSYTPVMWNYEVCVLQLDTYDNDAIKKTACRHFDYTAVDAASNDAQGKCDSEGKCLRVTNLANND